MNGEHDIAIGQRSVTVTNRDGDIFLFRFPSDRLADVTLDGEPRWASGARPPFAFDLIHDAQGVAINEARAHEWLQP